MWLGHDTDKVVLSKRFDSCVADTHRNHTFFTLSSMSPLQLRRELFQRRHVRVPNVFPQLDVQVETSMGRLYGLHVLRGDTHARGLRRTT